MFFIQIPWGLKSIWQMRLLELVEAWAGVPIEQTVMYGLRQYERGARLLTHVDRTSTHAVSLIVNGKASGWICEEMAAFYRALMAHFRAHLVVKWHRET